MDDKKYIMIGVEYLQSLYSLALESMKSDFESQQFDNLFLPSSLEINEKYLTYIIGSKIEADFPDNDYDDPKYDILLNTMKNKAINTFRKNIPPHICKHSDDKRICIIYFIHNM